MKKRKINPRTGIIGVGVPRPQRPPPSVQPLTSHYPSKQTEVDMNGLVAIAKEIGKAIADEIRKGIQVINPSSEAIRGSQINVPTEDVDRPPPSKISIDESLMDFGLGDVKELKKGGESASIAEKEIREDNSFRSVKSKLRKLKRGK